MKLNKKINYQNSIENLKINEVNSKNFPKPYYMDLYHIFYV